jgi:hypothetical protein
MVSSYDSWSYTRENHVTPSVLNEVIFDPKSDVEGMSVIIFSRISVVMEVPGSYTFVTCDLGKQMQAPIPNQ